MNPAPLRVALIGTGGIGRYHLRLWHELAEVSCVGVFDLQASAAEAAARQWEIPTVFPTLADAVGDERVEAVVVATPNMFHREAVVAALRAGRHVLCEKPLAVTPVDIAAMIAARDASGKLLMTAQHMRFEHRTQALRRLLATGQVGPVYYSRAWWLRRRRAPSTPGFLKKSQAGRGPGMDLGVHVLDLALHLLDFPRPVTVSGISVRHLAEHAGQENEWGTYDPADFEVEEFAAGLVRFADGAALALEVSWLLNMLEKELWGVWLYGTAGGVQWPDLRLSRTAGNLLLDSQVANELGHDGHKNEMLAFAAAIRSGGPSPVPAEQSLIVARVLEALYTSAETGREVVLAP